MSRAPREPKTQQLPALRRLLATGVEVTTRMAVAPVFVDDAGRRRRLLARFGYLAAAACVAYLVVVMFSLTARPLGPLAGAELPLKDLAEPPAAPAVTSSPAPAPTVAAARPKPVVDTTTSRAAPTTTPPPVPAATSAPPTTTVAPTSSTSPTTTPTTTRSGRRHGR